MEDPRVVVTRPDGRPEAYDCIPEGERVQCEACKGTLRDLLRYKTGEAFMVSPVDAADGMPHWCCTFHLPDNAVIFNPKTNTCRDKTGTSVWTEGTAS